MAKTKGRRQSSQEPMQKRNDLAGSSKIDVGGGFCISTKMNMGGLMYLEDLYKKSVDQISFSGTSDIVNLLTALGISANPDMTVDDVKAKVLRIDSDRADQITAQLPQAKPKNIPEKAGEGK